MENIFPLVAFLPPAAWNLDAGSDEGPLVFPEHEDPFGGKDPMGLGGAHADGPFYHALTSNHLSVDDPVPAEPT